MQRLTGVVFISLAHYYGRDPVSNGHQTPFLMRGWGLGMRLYDT